MTVGVSDMSRSLWFDAGDCRNGGDDYCEAKPGDLPECRAFQQRDLSTVVRPVLDDAVQQVRHRIVEPFHFFVNRGFVETAHVSRKGAMTLVQRFDKLGPRARRRRADGRPVLLRRWIAGPIAVEASARNFGPGGHVSHDLPDTMPACNRL